MNGWHSQARVRGPAPDPEQVALQLCRGWPCQPAHPLGQAQSPRGSLLGPKVRRPTGEAPPTREWSNGSPASDKLGLWVSPFPLDLTSSILASVQVGPVT